jgi:DNA-binding transcriptional LysR family regulator
MVRQGALDLAIVSAEPAELPHDLDAEVIDVDHLVLVGPPGHPQGVEPIPVAALDGVELIGFRARAGLRQAAEIAYEAAGVAPQVIVESNEMPVLLGLVEHGLGLAVLPEGFLGQSRAPLWQRPLGHPLPSR